MTAYADLVSLGNAAREQKDGAQWKLGIIAQEVSAGDLKRYASDINIGYSTLLGYRLLVSFYASSPGGEGLRDNPLLTFSHFKYAMRLGDLADALAFLEECADNAWNPDLAYAVISERLGSPPVATKLAEFSDRGEAIRWLQRHTGAVKVMVYDVNRQAARM